MDATRCLCEEHDLILQVLDRLELVLDQARQTGKAHRSIFEPFLEFFGGFTVGAHFCKEEHALFPLLHGRGVPHEGSPLAALAQEHELVRTLVRDLSADLELADRNAGAALSSLLGNGRRLVELLRGHIARADHCVFGMAAALLCDADPREIERVFGAAERRAGDPATLKRWRALGHELAQGGSGSGAECESPGR